MTRDNDEGDPWRSVLELVSGALDDLEPRLRDAVLDGVRTAKEGLGEPEPGRPKVVVLDGGKKAGSTEPTIEEANGEPDVRVRVLRDIPGGRRVPLGDEGRIRVRGGEAAEWQTVLRAEAARCYRILCTTGSLEILIDGLPGERLRAGQSLDVEAKLLRVRSGDDGVGLGTYVRIG